MGIFAYHGKLVRIHKRDPSDPSVSLEHMSWSLLSQHVYDQLEDTPVFTKKEMEEFSEMKNDEFISHIKDDGTQPFQYFINYKRDAGYGKVDQTVWAQSLPAFMSMTYVLRDRGYDYSIV